MADRRKIVPVAAAMALVALGCAMVFEIIMIAIGQNVSPASGSAVYALRPHNARAAAYAAARSLEAGQLEQAEQTALSAIRSSPIDVVAIRTLWEVRNKRSKGVRDDRLMLLAGEWGWRDRPTQVWLIERAVRAGDVPVAVQRSEALVRLRRDADIAFSLLRLLGANPDARKLLVATMAEQPIWRHDFLTSSSRMSKEELAGLSALVNDLIPTKAPPTPSEARAAIDTLVAAGRADLAYNLYRKVQAPRSGDGNLLPDGDFERKDLDYRSGGSSTVFDWRVYQAGDSSAAPEAHSDDKKNRVIFAVADGSTRFRVMERILRLVPGSYRLSYRIQSDDPEAGAAFQFAIRCLSGGASLLAANGKPLKSRSWEHRGTTFSVPAGGCGDQVLELQVLPDLGGMPREAAFDRVSIKNIGNIG